MDKENTKEKYNLKVTEIKTKKPEEIGLEAKIKLISFANKELTSYCIAEWDNGYTVVFEGEVVNPGNYSVKSKRIK